MTFSLNWFGLKSSDGLSSEEKSLIQEFFEATYPEYKISRLHYTGRKQASKYIAVVYEMRTITRPFPYKLFELADGVVEEVDMMDFPEFAIRGLK